MKYYVGIDLGGTNVKAGLVDANTNVLAKLQVPTQVEAGPDKVIAVMADAARQVVERGNISMDQVASIGIGSPGSIDYEAGVILSAPNLTDFNDLPLRNRVTEVTGRPVILENDANAAAFGEFWAGAGRDQSIRHLVMFTLGTGVGTGLIIDGKLIRGAFGLGAEGGHMIIEPNGRPCGCGQKGCLEAYTSAPHTAARATEAVETGGNSSLQAILNDNRLITSKDVFDAAAKGDPLANRIVDETVFYLALGCISICRLLDPQMIVFAGGMILAGDILFERLHKSVDRQNWKMTKKTVEIVPAKLGNDAGFIGAAAVAWDADQNA